MWTCSIYSLSAFRYSTSFIIMAVPNHNAPKGMESYDIGALSQEQQEKLNQFKVSTVASYT